jgi:hypothetical protein
MACDIPYNAINNKYIDMNVYMGTINKTSKRQVRKETTSKCLL